jgi:hypothetical protein
MRQLEKTPEIVSLLQDSLGFEADISQFAVYETIAINTLPIRKSGSIFNGATLTPQLLQEMANHVNTNKKLPLQTMHDMQELPVGTSFHAMVSTEFKDQQVVTELRQLFYVSANTADGKDVIAKLESGTINEVSVNFMSQHQRCSTCGWDYMGPDSTFMNFWDRTCANDHVVGENGTHLLLDGLSKYYELSLVNVGAANNANILSRRESAIVRDQQRIAASSGGKSNNMAICLVKTARSTEMNVFTKEQHAEFTASLTLKAKAALEANFSGVKDLLGAIPEELNDDSAKEVQAKLEVALGEFAKLGDPKDPEPKEDPAPEETTLKFSVDNFIDLKADLKIAKTQLAAHLETNSELSTKLVTVTAELTEATTKLKELEVVKAEADTAVEFLKLSYQHSMVASGAKDFSVPGTVNELIAGIKLAQSSLSKFPTGGVAMPADANTKASAAKGHSGSDDAYKTK